MRLAICADLHVGNHALLGGAFSLGMNERCRAAVDVLDAAVRLADSEQCVALYVLGDLFDNTKPLPQMLAAVQHVLSEARCDVNILLGNHELASTSPGDHALGPLAEVASIIDSPKLHAGMEGVDVHLVPFAPGPATTWLPEALAALDKQHTDASATRILLTHVGIADGATPGYLRTDDHVPVDFMRGLAAHGFAFVAAGHWHEHRTFQFKDCLVTQVGALCPTGWDNPGIAGYGSLLVWDSDDPTAMQRHVLSGPRFIEGDPADPDKTIATLSDPRAVECQLYLRLTAQLAQREAAQDLLRRALVDQLVVAGQVLPDRTEVRESSGRAAAAARSADTLDDKLAAWVDNMDTTADRQVVLRLAKAYLHG